MFRTSFTQATAMPKIARYITDQAKHKTLGRRVARLELRHGRGVTEQHPFFERIRRRTKQIIPREGNRPEHARKRKQVQPDDARQDGFETQPHALRSRSIRRRGRPES